MSADPGRRDNDVDALRARFEDDLAAARSEADLRGVRDRYLARKGGLVSGLLKDLGQVPAADRPRLGQLANQLKVDIESKLAERLAAASASRPPADAVDVTLPGRRPYIGHRHPLTILRERIEAIFTRFGFLVIEGAELEDDYHNFEALNMPPEHPARDMQDTLYLSSPVTSGAGTPATLLRTHTSGMQIRYMEKHQPPVRLIAPGRVYRRDNFDLTHTPMFTQVEGLVVGENVSLADLKGTLTAFVHELFGPDRKVRFRPSFFPYTEPSAELDISCGAVRRARAPGRLRHVQAHGLAGDPWQRHGAPGRLRGCRLRRRPLHGLCLRHGHRAHRAPQVGRRGYSSVLRKRPPFPGAVPAVKIVYPWLLELVRAPGTPESIAHEISLRGFEVASVEPGRNAVIDFEITANRPDCMSHLGIAREASAIWGLPLQMPALSEVEGPALSEVEGPALSEVEGLDVTIEAPDLCPRYCAQVFEVKVGPSPQWLADRLTAAGVRPISNIVDVTNYVLLELGQPMHAFDLERLAKRSIVVRRARPGERMKTLDGVERALEPDMLVIADAERASAVGGVMGGHDSEIGPATTRIALESAYFHPPSIRRTSKRLGLKTEAAMRFERGGDVAAAPLGIARAAALFKAIGAGRPLGPMIDRYPSPRPQAVVGLRARANLAPARPGRAGG